MTVRLNLNQVGLLIEAGLSDPEDTYTLGAQRRNCWQYIKSSSWLEFANKASHPKEGFVAALRNDHDKVADMHGRRTNLDHVRDLITDEDIEAKLEEAIVRVGATKQHRELQSSERNRTR